MKNVGGDASAGPRIIAAHDIEAFDDISIHIVEAEFVGRLAADGLGLVVAVARMPSHIVGIVAAAVGEIFGGWAAAGRPLPLVPHRKAVAVRRGLGKNPEARVSGEIPWRQGGVSRPVNRRAGGVEGVNRREAFHLALGIAPFHGGHAVHGLNRAGSGFGHCAQSAVSIRCSPICYILPLVPSHLGASDLEIRDSGGVC